ncbi:hypothetical protein GCM10028807_19980 [Spirosoma daeguense]
MLKILHRTEIDTNAWNACVAASMQRIVYGYSWYLDAVLPLPMWKWEGIVLTDESATYQAVMAIPLRRKQWAGITIGWVVHQPFFCQFLSVFCRTETTDWHPFFQLLVERYSYGAILNLIERPNPTFFDTIERFSTHTIDLSNHYVNICGNYSLDRKTNLKQARKANWHVVKSTDVRPLIRLFQENHAAKIPGGVADWAYEILQNLVKTLQKHNVVRLSYAIGNGRIEAGALFVQEGHRIIYLFNAASKEGRKGNARTVLIDQLIQEQAGKSNVAEPVLFDFESPSSPSIRAFYQSFGALETTFWQVNWNRLNPLIKAVLRVRQGWK